MKWSVLILVVIGIAGAFCVALITARLRMPVAPATVVTTSQPVEEATIVVANTAMPAMTVVSADTVDIRRVPLSAAGANSIAHPASIIGKVLVVPVLPQQELTKNCFANEGSGLRLSSVLPVSKRAMTVCLDDRSGIENLLYPGSIVDVLVTLKMDPASHQAVATTLLRGISVLAVGNKTVLSEDTESAQASGVELANRARKPFVTLMVDSKQAQALQLAVELGKISLVMRNPADSQSVSESSTLLTQLSSEYANWLAKIEARDKLLNAPPPVVKPPPPPPQPATLPATRPVEIEKPPTWETTVIRGSQSENQVFRLKKSQDRAAQNIIAPRTTP